MITDACRSTHNSLAEPRQCPDPAAGPQQGGQHGTRQVQIALDLPGRIYQPPASQILPVRRPRFPICRAFVPGLASRW